MRQLCDSPPIRVPLAASNSAPIPLIYGLLEFGRPYLHTWPAPRHCRGPFFHPRDFPSAPLRAVASARVTWCAICDIAAGEFSSTPRKGASAPASPWLRKRTRPTSRCGCASAAGSHTGCGSKPSSTPGSRPSSTGRAALRNPAADFGEKTRVARQRDAHGRCAALTEAE